MLEKLQYLPLRGISRVDSQKKGNYWLVRINWVNRKPIIQKLFHDSTYGGVAKSFEAAVKYRDENIDISMIKRRKERRIENSHLENSKITSLEKRNKWKKERLERRISVIKKTAKTLIHVGTGFEGAIKARSMGASKVTCWKISSGRQDFYMIGSFMPGYHIPWKDLRPNRKSDIGLQKNTGKKKIQLGTGRDAAIKAAEMGANSRVCNRIFSGKQDFFYCCYSIPFFEVNGFKRGIPDEIIKEIRILTKRYAYQNADDIATEVMINYASRNEIPNDKSFIRKLVFKYIKINKLSQFRKKGHISLDINGSIERFNDSGKSFGIGVEPEPMWINLTVN